MESFASMFEESLTRKEMRAGELITAQVVRVEQNMVVVNAGLKSESFIPVEEFHDATANSKSRQVISSPSRLSRWKTVMAKPLVA